MNANTKSDPPRLRISINDAMVILGYKSDDSIYRLIARNVLTDLRPDEDKRKGVSVWLDPREVNLLAMGKHEELRAYQLKLGRARKQRNRKR